MIGVIVIVVLTLAYKVIFRTPWRNLEDADCLTGRRKLDPEEINELDAYYRMSRWRRFATYVQLW